jgi:hypothetical protein
MSAVAFWFPSYSTAGAAWIKTSMNMPCSAPTAAQNCNLVCGASVRMLRQGAAIVFRSEYYHMNGCIHGHTFGEREADAEVITVHGLALIGEASWSSTLMSRAARRSSRPSRPT